MKRGMKEGLQIVSAIAFIAMALLISGCGRDEMSIRSFRINEVVINKMIPIEGEVKGFEAKELKSISNKKTIKQLISALKSSEKVDKNLGYAKNDGVHYEIQLIYKKSEKDIFTLWIDENSDQAVFSGIGYHNLSGEATELIKSLIFDGDNED